MRPTTLLDLLPPPCACDPRRSRYAARLVARAVREADELDGAQQRRDWLASAERLAQRIGPDPSLSTRLDALRRAMAAVRARV